MKKSFALISCLLLTCASIHTASAQPDNLHITTLILDNGLTVYLNEDHNKPEIFGAVAVKAGSKYDPADATGMAHYLEHMCFKGTPTLGTRNYEAEKPLLDSITLLYDTLAATTDEKDRQAIQLEINRISVAASEYAIPNEMDRLLKSIGSTGVNAFTSFEQVVYHNTFPAHQTEKWLDLYSERFINPVFRLFQSELEVVYEEKNMYTDNFGTALFEQYMGNFFKNHPYGQQTTIGSTAHLKNPSLRKMQEYYDQYFRAGNMALVLSGDFNTDSIIPLIKEKFGRWPAGSAPEFPEYHEEPFRGREFLQVRLSPIKVGAIGFRTVPKNHPDEIPLRVLEHILSNPGETGLLNELRLENQIQYSEALSMTLQDHGGIMLLFIPKIIGQSLDNAEQLVRDKLELLKQGKYDKALLTSARNNLRAEFYRNLESNADRALYIIDSYINGQDWNDFLAFPDKVASVTEDDITRVAAQYFGENCLVLHSKMGFPKKDRLDKPGFEPVTQQEDVKSAYAQKFENLPSAVPVPRFVNMQQDVRKSELAAGQTLYQVTNPINDIFSLKIHYQAGWEQIPLLNEAAMLMTFSGTATQPLKEFKKAMSGLGCSYTIQGERNELILTLSGLEENLAEAVSLLHSLMESPASTETNLELMLGDLAAERKIETGDPQMAADLLAHYLIYGESSVFLQRPSLKELKKIPADSLYNCITEVRRYPLNIHFTGRSNPDKLDQLLRQYNFGTDATLALNRPVHPDRRVKYTEPVIYFLNRKDARQSHIYIYGPAGNYNRDSILYMQAFNQYFGGGMSSLMFQEIRELRSLAYAAFTYLNGPLEPHHENYLYGYIGCQSDKTGDAITAFMHLASDMPLKPERMGTIRSGLIETTLKKRPDFRNLSQTVEYWERFGYTTDPNIEYLERFRDITFDDLTDYYQKNFRSIPISLAITGNRKDIPLEELKKYGQVVIVKEKDVVRK